MGKGYAAYETVILVFRHFIFEEGHYPSCHFEVVCGFVIMLF